MNILQLLKINLNNIYNKYISNIEDNAEIFYIGGSQTLPPPLSQDEEENTYPC